MEMTGERLIKADRETVFDALNDTEILSRAIPGCKSLEREGEDQLAATVQAKVGPVKATFKGKVTLSGIVAPERYTISGEGKGGAAGFAKGSAEVVLSESDDGTLLSYTVKADVGGKLAQIGARLIDGTARKLSGEFFDAFAAELEPDAPAENDDQPDTPDTRAENAPDPIEPVAATANSGDPMVFAVLGIGVVLGLFIAAMVG